MLAMNVECLQAQTANNETAMKKWMELAMPGDAHKKLSDFAGSWETATTMWMQGQDKPPTKSKGTAELIWILDGRFLQHETKGEFMGMPSQGIGYNGYDNITKKYTMFWIDNSATAMYTAEGNFDKSGTTLTLYGKIDDATTGEYGKNVKYVIKILDKDRWIFEFHDDIYEPYSKVGETVYTRKQ
jgi:hypothetical protein